ncbi:hypothetical protein Droror1_Dr00027184 [Drosera rotundifolia]
MSEALNTDVIVQGYPPTKLYNWDSTVKRQMDLKRVYLHGYTVYGKKASVIGFLYNFENHGADPRYSGEAYMTLEYVENIRYEYYPSALSWIMLEVFYHIVVNNTVKDSQKADLELLWNGACAPAKLSKMDYHV